MRKCLVDGDFAPKNMLVAPDGRSWVFDLEVTHVGNPVFDVGFFLSFPLLSAVRWPELYGDLHELAEGFLDGYASHGRRRLRRRPLVDHSSHRLPHARAHRRPLACSVPGRAIAGAGTRGRDRTADSTAGRDVGMALTIERVLAWEALDSRGTPTVACVVTLAGGAEGEAIVPSGASVGTHEAHELRDGADRFAGKGTQSAVAYVNGEIAEALRGADAGEQEEHRRASSRPRRDVDARAARRERRAGRVGRVRNGRRGRTRGCLYGATSRRLGLPCSRYR